MSFSDFDNVLVRSLIEKEPILYPSKKVLVYNLNLRQSC